MYCRQLHLDGWQLKYIDQPSRLRVGECCTAKKTILLDVRVFDLTPANVLDILRHELAHAIRYDDHGFPQSDVAINREVYGDQPAFDETKSISWMRRYNKIGFQQIGHDIGWARLAIGLGCQLQYATAGYDLEILRRAIKERALAKRSVK